jgi:hypothetical protein
MKLPSRPPDGSTEVVKLALLAIDDQRRSRRLELLDGLPGRRIIKRVQTRVRTVAAGTNGLDQPVYPGPPG